MGKEKALEGERGRDEQEEVKGGDVGPGFSNQGVAPVSGLGSIRWGVCMEGGRGRERAPSVPKHITYNVFQLIELDKIIK